jgi:hypothetical protein
MIFVAPLQGESDGQLIVSPISTMVHASMQEDELPFELAKESVANELGVPGNVLLTNYKVRDNQTNYDNEPGKLNFALKGTFTVNYVASQWETVDCVFSDFFIAQGHTWDHNNWWIGGPGCSSQGGGAVTCDCKNKDGTPNKLTFYGDSSNARIFLIADD